jgi:hypothetical protein
MTTEQFWAIIDAAREQDTHPQTVAASVRSALESLGAEEVLGFAEELRKRQAESYRWDLWAVAYIVNGGCSDDGFDYFRGWLIAKGRNYFEAALADPARAADDADPGANEWENMLDVAASVYQSKTGNHPPKSDIYIPKEPAGKQWEEDDLQSLCTELCERFS